MRWDCASYLSHHAAAQRSTRRCRDVRWPVVVAVAGRNLAPPLYDVVLDIRHSWSLDESVHIMPGMRGNRPLSETLGGNGRMMVSIPAIIVTSVLRRQINAAQECGPTIYDTAFLVKRLGEVCDGTAAFIEQA